MTRFSALAALSSLSLVLVTGVSGLAILEESRLQGLRAPCVIRLDSSSEWPSKPPIITDVNDDPVMPDGSYENDDRTITVAEGDQINLSCTGTSFQAFSGEEFAAARCIGGTMFDVTTFGGTTGAYDFGDLGCTVQPDSVSFRTGKTCGPNNEGIEVELGFPFQADFEETITVCFDEQTSRVIYAYHILYDEIEARDTGNDRPDFDPDGFFPFDVDAYYKSSKQLETVSELVGSSSLGAQYIRPNENYFMSRGHLSPNADFVYYSWQDSTFFFINVAPQWQVFNGGNWNILENAVRTFVENRDSDVVVYSGTNGVMELDDINGNKVEIWLYPEENRLPAPKYYWKILVDEVEQTGVAFVGVNNPHISSGEIDSFKSVCSNILADHPIMDSLSKPDDIKNGVTFACAVSDISSSFPEIPDLGDLGILQ